MKNVVITAVITAVLVVILIGGPIIYHADKVLVARDMEITELELRRENDFADWKEQQSTIYDLKKNAKLFTDGWNAWVKRLSDEKAVLKAEITEWEACAAKRNAGPNIPDPAPQPVPFTDQVQTSLKGVVHLQAPYWQGSGFVIDKNTIGTARHCAENVEDFLMTMYNDCQIRATRAISSKDYDLALIRIDNLECVNEDIDHRVKYGGEHDVVLSALPLGSIKDCVLGQNVYVIGSPYGKVNFNSLTTGIISGLDRDWSPLGDNYGWEVAFTVDSAGHPGNSGCPVFTTDGVVRGILVGGFSPVLISVMPWDLYLGDLESIRLVFTQDRYKREEAVGRGEDWYNHRDDTEYYD